MHSRQSSSNSCWCSSAQSSTSSCAVEMSRWRGHGDASLRSLGSPAAVSWSLCSGLGSYVTRLLRATTSSGEDSARRSRRSGRCRRGARIKATPARRLVRLPWAKASARRRAPAGPLSPVDSHWYLGRWHQPRRAPTSGAAYPLQVPVVPALRTRGGHELGTDRAEGRGTPLWMMSGSEEDFHSCLQRRQRQA